MMPMSVRPRKKQKGKPQHVSADSRLTRCRLAQLYQIYRGLLAIRPNLHTYIFNTLAEDPDSDIIRHIGGIVRITPPPHFYSFY